MSVCLEGDMDAQLYFYEKYGDMPHHVSFEEYAEYIEYKNQQNNKTLKSLQIVGIIILLLIIDLKIILLIL